MISTERKQVNNAAYRTAIDIGASKLKQVAWYFTNVLFFINPLNPVSSLKVFLLKIFGAKLGAGVVIKPSVNIKYPWKLQVGDHSWVGEHVWIDNLSTVAIGNHVTLSQGCLLLTGSHDASRETFDFQSQPIILEDGVWIGAKAVVSGGSRCGTHSILGINSVAENDLQPYTIYKGNPAIPVLRRIIH
jgi:putative colanic acid biosynthesis acetyltransferase WcaF